MLSFPRPTRSHFVLAACLFLALAMLGGCSSEEQKRAEALREAGALYELAGLGNGLDHYIADLTARAAVYEGGLDAEAAQRLRTAVAGAINPAEARAVAIEGLAARYEKITGVQVRAWYEGEVGGRILAMEIEAGEGDYEAKLREFIDERLLSEVPRAERTTLIKRLITATRANSDEAAADAGIMRTLYLGERLMRPESERQTVEEIETSLANREATLANGLQFTLFIALQFVYEHASDDDLAKYAAFCESEAGIWLFDANRESLAAVMAHLEQSVIANLSEANPAE